MDSLRAALTQYGAGVVLLILAVIFLEWLLIRSFQQRLGDKDKEIKRMADRNEQLEKLILKKRISTRAADTTQALPPSTETAAKKDKGGTQ